VGSSSGLGTRSEVTAKYAQYWCSGSRGPSRPSFAMTAPFVRLAELPREVHLPPAPSGSLVRRHASGARGQSLRPADSVLLVGRRNSRRRPGRKATRSNTHSALPSSQGTQPGWDWLAWLQAPGPGIPGVDEWASWQYLKMPFDRLRRWFRSRRT
jgi:hypothetical protein